MRRYCSPTGAVIIGFGTIAESALNGAWVVDRGGYEDIPSIGNLDVDSRRGAAGHLALGWGPASDIDGNIYVLTGNGDFDGMTDFGESIVKLRYTAPARHRATGSLAAVDWWTPWTDDGRIGKTRKAKGDMQPKPTNFRKVAHLPKRAQADGHGRRVGGSGLSVRAALCWRRRSAACSPSAKTASCTPAI